VQITWIGSEGTTGLGAMEYLLADARLIPEGEERHYREKILRLPETYVAYEPPPDAPPVAPAPALRHGFLTLASFNNPAKLNEQVISLWARLLHRLPDARLVLKYRGLTDSRTFRRWTDIFAAHGITAPRLELQDWSPHAETLAEYQNIDLALDPFPFGGGATTCEALWMGVPVVTWPGSTVAGRHSLSFLSTIGLGDAVAADADEYVELVFRWGSDRERLAAVRSQLRERMAASPLCDGRRLANFLAGLFEEALT
jgi:predicted O-linked N-acetylglucosamine transferase (SPINDLY family)